jgi:hypothetical protein
MDHKVHVEPPSMLRSHSVLQAIVQRLSPIDGATGNDANPVEDAERIAIDGERGTIETVKKNATCALPGQSR